MEIADINLSLLPIINRLFEIIRRQKTKTSVTTFTLSFFPRFTCRVTFSTKRNIFHEFYFQRVFILFDFLSHLIWFCVILSSVLWRYILSSCSVVFLMFVTDCWCAASTLELHNIWNKPSCSLRVEQLCSGLHTHTRLNRKAAQIHSAGKITPIINWSMMSLINCEINTRVKSQRRWPRTVFQVRSLNVLTNVYIRSAQNWKLEEICSSYIIESAT